MTSPPKSPKLAALSRLGLATLSLTGVRHRPWRVMVLGHTAVGKSAFVVRFLTRRFIGDYDPSLERIYTTNVIMDGDHLSLEILDSAGRHIEDETQSDFEAKIRWADAFVLVYSVTDKCSFDECCRLRFLIGYNKRRRRHLFGTACGTTSNNGVIENNLSVPVILIANKIDQVEDRMVTTDEGMKRSHDLGCDFFSEISVREQVDSSKNVIEQLYLCWKKNPHHLVCTHMNVNHQQFRPRSSTATANESTSSSIGSIFGRRCLITLGRNSHNTSSSMDVINEREDVVGLTTSPSFGSPIQDSSRFPEHFRSRASTDSSLSYRKRPEIKPSPPATLPVTICSTRPGRRMSMSLRGTNTTF